MSSIQTLVLYIRSLPDGKNFAAKILEEMMLCCLLNILSSHFDFDVMKLKSQKKRAFFGTVKLMGIMMNSLMPWGGGHVFAMSEMQCYLSWAPYIYLS